MFLSQVETLRPQPRPLSQVEGQKVAFDILSPQGQLLFKRGDRIKAEHISYLAYFETAHLPVLVPERVWVTGDKLEELPDVLERGTDHPMEEEPYLVCRVVERSSHLKTVSVVDEYCLHLARVHDLHNVQEKLQEYSERSLSLAQDIKRVYATLNSSPLKSKYSQLLDPMLEPVSVPEPTAGPFPLNSPRITKALVLMKRKRQLESKHLELFLEEEKLHQTALEEDVLDRQILKKLPNLLESEENSPYSQEVFDNLQLLHSSLAQRSVSSGKQKEAYRDLLKTLYQPHKEGTADEFDWLSNIKGDHRPGLPRTGDIPRTKTSEKNPSEHGPEQTGDSRFFRNIFPPDFMEQHTNFAGFKDFMVDAPQDRPAEDPVVQGPNPEWNVYVDEHTDFDSWKGMLEACNSYWGDHDAQDERSYARHSVDCAAQITTGQKTYPGQIVDISRTGLGIRSSERLKERQMIKITFPLPDSFDMDRTSEGIPHLQVLGVVQWVQNTAENIPTKAGVENFRKEVVRFESSVSSGNASLNRV